MENWLKVLKLYKNESYCHNGLTLPFLCGVQTVLDDNEKSLTVTDFFEIINSNDFGEEITIMKCGNINEYIFGILDAESKKMYLSYSEKGTEIYKRIKNVFLIDDSIDNIETEQNLVSFFEKEYNQTLSSNEFSKVNGNWSEYTEIDRNRINEINTGSREQW